MVRVGDRVRVGVRVGVGVGVGIGVGVGVRVSEVDGQPDDLVGVQMDEVEAEVGEVLLARGRGGG